MWQNMKFVVCVCARVCWCVRVCVFTQGVENSTAAHKEANAVVSRRSSISSCSLVRRNSLSVVPVAPSLHFTSLSF